MYEYDSVLKIMKDTSWVRFKECFDGKLWYECIYDASTDTYDDFYPFFVFPIPFDETHGAVFKDQDDKPMHFMRWIRKEFERQRDEAKMIADEKAKWDEELRNRDE